MCVVTAQPCFLVCVVLAWKSDTQIRPWRFISFGSNQIKWGFISLPHLFVRFAPGLYLIRFKSPKSFALSVCISARNSKFVHHVLEDTTEGFMLNKNDLTQTCWYTVLLFRNTI